MSKSDDSGVGCGLVLLVVWLFALTMFATQAVRRIERKLGLKPLTFKELYLK